MKKVEKESLPSLSREQQEVLAVISKDEVSFEQLALATGLPANSLSSTLTVLQLMGLIKSMPGKMYTRA